MKKKISLIAAIVLAALIICLLTWRFWPKSTAGLLSISEDDIIGFSASAMVVRLENGQSYTDMYRIDDIDPDEVMDILSASGYQQDLRNLLPWTIDSVGSDKNYDGDTVSLYFYAGPGADRNVEIQFLSSSIVAVSYDGISGYQIYHPTNRNTKDKLVEYLKTYGVKQTLA